MRSKECRGDEAQSAEQKSARARWKRGTRLSFLVYCAILSVMVILQHARRTTKRVETRTIAVRREHELGSSIRSGVEELFGRTLHKGEMVTFLSFPPHKVLDKPARAKALTRLKDVMKKVARNTRNTSDRQMHASIDEAMRHVRHWAA